MTAIHWHSGRHRLPAARHRAALDALGDTTGWIFATIREWRRRIRSRSELAKLDERMLADIGITRCDAEFLINKPFWRE